MQTSKLLLRQHFCGVKNINMAAMKLSLVFRMILITLKTTGGRHLKFGMETDHKHFQQIIFETLPGS